MKATKAILMIALALTLAITLTIHATNPQQKQPIREDHHKQLANPPIVKKRVSRFLAEKTSNPRAADHCHKNGDKCAATNTYCCNNKCVDLHHDKLNCGACKKKCKYTMSCCRGECVNLSYDKRHCGSCGSKCLKGQYCIYGMCNYA